MPKTRKQKPKPKPSDDWSAELKALIKKRKNPPLDDVWTLAKASLVLDMSQSTLYARVKEGICPSRKLGSGESAVDIVVAKIWREETPYIQRNRKGGE